MMIKKTYLMILSVAIVSVLLGSLFYNNVILAQTSGSEYDPWLDYNEDGIIDVHDLSPLGQAYGSSGDPTKNVTTTLAHRIGYYNDTSPPSSFITIDTRGYREITLVFSTDDIATVDVQWWVDGTGFHDSYFPIETINFLDSGGGKEWKTYQVQGAKLAITISALGGSVEYHISYYITA